MAEAIENNRHHQWQTDPDQEVNQQASRILEGQHAVHLLSEDGLWDAQDREAELGAYTAHDFSFVEIDMPSDPLEVLRFLWSEYVGANPNLPDGKLVLTGRTARAHHIIQGHPEENAGLHNGNGHGLSDNHQPGDALIFAETTTAPVT